MTNPTRRALPARISAARPYRFDGDTVDLHAQLAFPESLAPAGRRFALQLWANAESHPAGQPAGVKVAEAVFLPVAGIQEVAFRRQAMPPASDREQRMALVLATWNPDGEPLICDLVEYQSGEQFVGPRIDGKLSCTFCDGVATVGVERIVNPRPADNRSGTLALEVWALDAPYAGGGWKGVLVANVVLGVLDGGQAWTYLSHQIRAAAPDSGASLTVMLREWTAAGYLTRDFRNIDPNVPVVVDARARSDSPGKRDKRAARKRAATEAKQVSINRANAARLRTVKGVGEKLAKAIIASRPYATLDDLVRARGIGTKLLAKLRSSLRL